MKTYVLSFLLAFSGLSSGFALRAQTASDPEPGLPYIEVTGSSQLEVEPDEIILSIRIREYWEEEFARKSRPEDYRTKVPLERIERELSAALLRAGVRREDVSVQGFGDSWRERGKDFLMGKQYRVRVYDLKTVNRILGTLDTRGVENVSLAELKNRQIERYRQQGKIQALLAARDKAAYLLEAVGKRLGDIRFVEEPAEDSYYDGGAQYLQSNVMLDQEAGDVADDTLESVAKIRLRYRMRVRFSITDYVQ